MNRTARALGIGAALAVFVPVASTAPQDNKPAKATQAPAPLTPEQLWTAVRGAYGAVPTGDRVTVTVAGADGAGKESESFEVRIDPRPGNAAGPRVRLDLGLIRVVAGDGKLVAVHTLSREGAFVAEGFGALSPAALRAQMPPLPLPGLAALTDGALPAEAAGYVRPVEWTGATAEPDGTRSVVGRSGTVKARLTLAPSGRVRSLALTELPGGGSITAAFSELPALIGPADFELGAESWKRVGSIRELFQLPQTPVEPGGEIPELAVQTITGEPVVLNEVLAKVAPARVTRPDGSVDVEQDPPSAERTVLIIHRLPADPEACAALPASLAAARAALADVLYRAQRDRFLSSRAADKGEQPAHLPPISGAVVLVADLGEANAPARLERGERALEAAALPRAHVEFAPRVFEAASIAGAIGPFVTHTAPGDTLLVTVTRDWRLIRTDAWPAEMTAAQGAALVEKRLRGE